MLRKLRRFHKIFGSVWNFSSWDKVLWRDMGYFHTGNKSAKVKVDPRRMCSNIWEVIFTHRLTPTTSTL